MSEGALDDINVHDPSLQTRSDDLCLASKHTYCASRETDITCRVPTLAMPDEKEEQPSVAVVELRGGIDQGQTQNKSSPTMAIPQNPLEAMSNDELVADAQEFCEENGLAEHSQLFRRSCLAAKMQNIPNGFEGLAELTEEDKAVLRFEAAHQWKSAPRKLYLLCALCAGCAIVQGMDQTVINGAQVSGPWYAMGEDRLTLRHSPFTLASLA